MRFIGLDVHRDFCEVAIAEGGKVRLAGRVLTEPEALALFAQSLGVDDEVTLEATGNALEIARIIEPHVARVVLANAKAVKGITRAGAKTDKIDARTLAKLLAAVGEIGRFPTARQLVSYLGLDPRVSQSGAEPARHGRISKQGPGETRHVLVEAAWHAARAPGPLRAFHQRIASRRGGNIATVAVARQLAVIAWHMLSRGEDYAFARPSLTREKIRRLELMTGAQPQKGKRIGVWVTKEQHRLDNDLAAQAELAYRRLVQDWQPTTQKGTGAAPGRASRRPSSGQAARQQTAPTPAL